MTKEIKPICPDCGEERIVQWSSVPASTDVTRIVVDDDGRPSAEEDGVAEYVWDDATFEGYACAGYCQGKTFPLDHFTQ